MESIRGPLESIREALESIRRALESSGITSNSTQWVSKYPGKSPGRSGHLPQLWKKGQKRQGVGPDAGGWSSPVPCAATTRLALFKAQYLDFSILTRRFENAYATVIPHYNGLVLACPPRPVHPVLTIQKTYLKNVSTSRLRYYHKQRGRYV